MNRAILWGLGFLIVGLIAFVFFIAANIQVDYSDSYFLLSNAKTIALGNGPYDYHRFIVPSLFHAPAFLGNPLAWKIPHLLNAFGYGALSISLFFLFRYFLSSVTSLLATFLLLSTPLVIHYAPTVKEDLPAILFVVLALLFYLKERPWLAGLFCALAIGSRYNFAPILLGLFVFLEWRRRRWLPLLVFPLLLFLLFPLLVYTWTGHSTFGAAIPRFFQELLWQFQENKNRGFQSAGAGLILFANLVSFRYLAVAILGLVASAKQKRSGDQLFGIWLGIALLSQLYLVPGKEGRYFFICLPPIYYFVIRGLEELLSKRSRVTIAIISAFLFLGILQSAREIQKFSDPFYTRPFGKRRGGQVGAGKTWEANLGGRLLRKIS
jgi:hypothetical protein